MPERCWTRVQRRALGGRAAPGRCRAAAAGSSPASARPPSSTRPLDLDVRIERAKEGLGDRQAGHDDRLALSHHAVEACLGGDHRRRGDVAAVAQILGEGVGDEAVEIEAVEAEAHAPALPLRQR